MSKIAWRHLLTTPKIIFFYFKRYNVTTFFQVFFEHDFTSPIPFVPQRNDVRLTVKFQFCNYVSGIGDMVALFNADELARSGGNLNHAKAICMVNLAGHFGSMSVTFQRKNLLNDIFFKWYLFMHFYSQQKNTYSKLYHFSIPVEAVGGKIRISIYPDLSRQGCHRKVELLPLQQATSGELIKFLIHHFFCN